MDNRQDQDRNRQQQSGQQQGQQQASQQQQQSDQRSGQQQQFDSQGSRQPMGGGSGAEGSLADRIRPHQEVVDDSGKHLGTVDHIDGDRIKLARKDSPDGEHHYVALSQVAGIEGDRVRLRTRGDNDFGMEAGG